MSKPPKIKLIDTKIRCLKFELREGGSAEEVAFRFGIQSGYEYDYRKKRLVVMIGVRIDEEELPFMLEIEFQGLFELNKSLPRKRVDPFAQVNCPAILFPFLRECIADLTRRAGFPPLILPAINFVELAKKDTEEKKKKSGHK